MYVDKVKRDEFNATTIVIPMSLTLMSSMCLGPC